MKRIKIIGLTLAALFISTTGFAYNNGIAQHKKQNAIKPKIRALSTIQSYLGNHATAAKQALTSKSIQNRKKRYKTATGRRPQPQSDKRRNQMKRYGRPSP